MVGYYRVMYLVQCPSYTYTCELEVMQNIHHNYPSHQSTYIHTKKEKQKKRERIIIRVIRVIRFIRVIRVIRVIRKIGPLVNQ